MNWYRQALEGFFGGTLKVAKHAVLTPLVGFGSGAIGKELSEETLKAMGWASGIGGGLFGLASVPGEIAGKTAKTVAKEGTRAARFLGRGATEYLKEEIPALGRAAQNVWKLATVEAADEPLGRMLNPAIQTGLFVGITGLGAAKGLGSYQVSKMPSPVNIGHNAPQLAYDGRVARQALEESTYGLVQSLNALR